MSLSRKPASTATRARQAPRLPLRPVREKIIAAAAELIATGDTREVSRVLASRFSTGEAIIDRVLVEEAVRQRRIAATLRNGVINALDMAREAESEEAAA